MTLKGKQILEKFKELFPNLWNDGASVTELSNGVILINPVPGKRGMKYMFVYRANGTWELHYE